MKLSRYLLSVKSTRRNQQNRCSLQSASQLAPNQQNVILNGTLKVVNTMNPMERFLDHLLPFLSPHIVTSVIQMNQYSDRKSKNLRFFIWVLRNAHLTSKESYKLVNQMIFQDGFDLYCRVLDELKSSDIWIPPYAINFLISCYAKAGMADKAIECFERISSGEYNVRPRVYTFNSLLYAVLKKGVFLLAMAVYNKMVRLNLCPNVTTYGILMDGLYKCGQTRHARALFAVMVVRGVAPNVFTYTITIAGLCRDKMINEACWFYDKMKEAGCEPHPITYFVLLNGLCHSGMMDEALKLLCDFEERGYLLGIKGYSCLIDAMFGAGRFDEACNWYRRMCGEGIEPDVVLYAIMIRGYCHSGKVWRAWMLLKEMIGKGLSPDTYCYNPVIKGLCDMGLLTEAEALENDMLRSDCLPSAYTYTILICGMLRNGRVEDADRIFSKMENQGCSPSVVTYNVLIDGLCKIKEHERAFGLLYKMGFGKSPSFDLRLAQGWEKLFSSGSLLEAYKYIEYADSVIQPDINTYNILINGRIKAGKIDEACKIFKFLQEKKGPIPDSVTYGTLINGMFIAEKEDTAFFLFEKMKKVGVSPTLSVYKTMMTRLCQKGKVSLAFSLWFRYLQNRPGTDITAITLVMENFKRGELESAIHGLLDMDLKLNDFDISPYTILLIGYCQSDEVENALKIFSVLKVSSKTVSPASCVMLIDHLCDNGNLDEAVEVFHYTLENGIKLKSQTCNSLLRYLLSRDKLNDLRHILKQMKSSGYKLDVYLDQSTKDLLPGHWSIREMEVAAPG